VWVRPAREQRAVPGVRDGVCGVAGGCCGMRRTPASKEPAAEPLGSRTPSAARGSPAAPPRESFS
jgi:hypothetical protein